MPYREFDIFDFSTSIFRPQRFGAVGQSIADGIGLLDHRRVAAIATDHDGDAIPERTLERLGARNASM
jgi:hypothetical protein